MMSCCLSSQLMGNKRQICSFSQANNVLSHHMLTYRRNREFCIISQLIFLRTMQAFQFFCAIIYIHVIAACIPRIHSGMLYRFSFSFLSLQQENIIMFLWYMKQIITLIANYDILLDHLHKSFVLNKGTRCDKPLILQKKEKATL